MRYLDEKELRDAFLKVDNLSGMVTDAVRGRGFDDIRGHIAYLELAVAKESGRAEKAHSFVVTTFADYLERVEAKVLDTRQKRHHIRARLSGAAVGNDWEEVAKLAVELEGYDVFLRHLDELSNDLKEAIERKEE